MLQNGTVFANDNVVCNHMERWMKSLAEHLKDAFNTMAFVDTAEMLNPRDKRRVLAGIPLDPAQRAQPRRAGSARCGRQIALSLGEALHAMSSASANAWKPAW